MFKNKRLILVMLVGVVMLFAPGVARAENGYCFCGSDLTKSITDPVADCNMTADEKDCLAKQSSRRDTVCKFFADSNGITDRGESACSGMLKQWQVDSKKTTETQSSFRGISSSFIPECLLQDNLSKECRDVSIFVYFLIQFARYLFTVIGALALIMFVYGGFTLILSQGNAEKVKKGTGIIVAAVIGLVIMFGAYMLVSFLGEAVDVQSQFKLK